MADVVVIEFSSPDAVSIYHGVNKIITPTHFRCPTYE